MDSFVEQISDQRYPSFASFRYYRKYGLTLEDCQCGILSACRFFGIPSPATIADFTNNSTGGTMFLNRNNKSYADDVISFDLAELQRLAVHSKDAFTLIMTHECAHRLLQNTTLPGLNNGQWEEELCCDFFIGVRAALEQLPAEALNSVCKGLINSPGASTHPTGKLRCEVIHFGCQVGCALLQNRQSCTISELLNCFEKWRQCHANIIRESQVQFYGY